MIRHSVSGSVKRACTPAIVQRAAHQSNFQFNGFILRDARKSGLLGMRSQTLMVKSASSRVSNHEATEGDRKMRYPLASQAQARITHSLPPNS
jgi:hypothetical protein